MALREARPRASSFSAFTVEETWSPRQTAFTGSAASARRPWAGRHDAPLAVPPGPNWSCRPSVLLFVRAFEGRRQREVAVQERGDDALLLLGTDTRGVVVIEAEDVGVAASEQGVEPGRSVRSRDVRIEVA